MSGLAFSWLWNSSSAPPARSELAEASDRTPEDTLTALLSQFEEPSGSLPATSRFAGELGPQREGQPLKILGLWRHAFFLAGKAKDLATDVAAYHIYGPRRKSWGLEMTMIASFSRNLALHSHLTDLPTMRSAMSLAGLLPTPSDALITPITFRVKRRNLRGMLAEFDRAENGRREISGEWVVSKRLWVRLQKEWKGGAIKAKNPDHKVKERIVLFLHGGAYYACSAATHRLITLNLSKYLDARVFVPNYRLAPDTRFPGPLYDAAAAYFRLTEDLKIPPAHIVLAGDSAGAGLCTALMMYLRDEGYPLPSAAILMCPWVDLTMSCASWDTNAGIDLITFPTEPEDHMNPVACYLGGPEGMKKWITHPYASPLFGNFRGLPPMLIQCGDCEVLRDEVTLMAHKATLAGVEVVHEIYEDAVHVFQLYPFLEQSRKAFKACKQFIFSTLPELQRKEAAAAQQTSIAESGAAVERGRLAVEKELGSDRSSSSDCRLDDQVAERLGGEIGKPGTKVFDGSGHERTFRQEDEAFGTDEAASSESSPEREENVPPNPEDVLVSITDELEMVIDEAPTTDTTRPDSLDSSSPLQPSTPVSDMRSWRRPAGLRPLSPIQTTTASSSTRSQPQSPVHTKAHNTFAASSPTKRFTTLPHHSSSTRTRAPLIPSINLKPTLPQTRSRVHSHPDIVSLLKQYAESGPANKTMTYQHVDADKSN